MFKTCVYFSNWSVYQKKHFPQDIPIDYYTHIFYAFILIDEQTGKVKFSDEWCDLQMPQPTPNETICGNLQQFYQMKKSNRHLKVIMSIGGWGTCHLFESVVNDKNKFNNFITSAIEFVEEYGFDGIDIDWEYPKNTQQADKFVELLGSLRQNLDPKYILTVAAPGGNDNIEILKVKEMDRYLTFWNLMCYDFAGEGWSSKTGFHSNLFGNNGDNNLNASDIVEAYTSKGVDPSKLVLGMPLYGRVFHGVEKPGIALPFTRDRKPGCIETDVIDYKNIETSNCDQEIFDSRKVSALKFNSKTKELITYDNPQSAKIKSGFVRSHKLGGGMWWDSAGDVANEGSLVKNFVEQLGGVEVLDKSENNICYNNSGYLK
ncbi:CHT4 Chitinase 4 [Candida maltosa Xu316]